MSKLWEFVGGPLDGQHKDDGEFGFMSDGKNGVTEFFTTVKGYEATYRKETWMKRDVMLYDTVLIDKSIE